MSRKTELMNRINRLLDTDSVPVLRVYVNHTPPGTWALTSPLPVKEILRKLKEEQQEPVLYKEVPCSGLSEDTNLTVTSEKLADSMIELFKGFTG